MCGSIKYENIAHKIGNLVTVFKQTGEKIEAPWLGHIRDDNPNPPADKETVVIPVKEYTEKGVWFSVPENYAIEANLITNKAFPNGYGVFIVTRNATKEELKKCSHPRHPRFLKLKKKI
jgi:hypothetical protein